MNAQHKPLYDETAVARNGRRIRNEFVRLLLAELILIAMTVISIKLRLRILCIASIIACGAAAMFLGDLRLRPLLNYGKYLKNMLTGLKHERSGAVEQVGDTPVYEEGVWFYEIILDGDRRFLLDAAFPEMRPKAGEQVEWLTCDQRIAAI